MIPSNSIIYKYTPGGELINALTYETYKGYYYEINGKMYAGKEFDISAIELIKATSENVNSLKKNSITSLYGYLTNITLPNSNLPSISINEEPGEFKYVAKKNNTSKIFLVSEETYLKEKNNPLYTILEIPYNLEYGFLLKEEDEKTMPGIIAFATSYSNYDDEEEET
jgi:hypothetical protein